MNILIIEDDPMVRRINEQFARKTGFVQDLRFAESAAAAKEMFREDRTDLVLLDVYLPGDNGLSFLKWLRENDIHTAVILITADRNPSTVETALSLGAADYLIKPFSYERFLEALMKAEQRLGGLKEGLPVEQCTIDTIFSAGAAARPAFIDRGETDARDAVLDKGLSAHTYAVVLEGVKKAAGRFTAEELSSGLGLSRVTVRRYLEYMEQKGILSLEMEYGKPGRPQHSYRLTGEHEE